MNLDNLQRVFSRSDIAEEFFYPLGCCVIDSGLCKIRPGMNYRMSSSGGLRAIPEPSVSASENFINSIHDSNRTDLVRLISSIQNMRRIPDFENVVLSSNSSCIRDASGNGGKRILFVVDASKEMYRDDFKAAAFCHKNILRAAQKAGFKISSESSFDESGGFENLKSWAAGVRYIKGFSPIFWCILIPLLLLLLYMMMQACNCVQNTYSKMSAAFRKGLETEAVIVVLDKSGSMDCCFDKVRDQTTALIKQQRKKWGNSYMDLILFDSQQDAAFGELKKLDDDTEKDVTDKIPKIASGGTLIVPALIQAVKEVDKHDKPTTIILVTDGEDNNNNSITNLIDKPEILRDLIGDKKLAEKGLIINTVGVHRPDVPKDAKNPYHENLKKLSKEFNGVHEIWDFSTPKEITNLNNRGGGNPGTSATDQSVPSPAYATKPYIMSDGTKVWVGSGPSMLQYARKAD
ncbi:MAG: VWA domain-containing protein [Planctomycetaceae bacterium]|jgi:Mg-chelatase subunit ChlD|nr:VWA domain-containing protein [Planctomycetaceae bacterium]